MPEVRSPATGLWLRTGMDASTLGVASAACCSPVGTRETEPQRSRASLQNSPRGPSEALRECWLRLARTWQHCSPWSAGDRRFGHPQRAGGYGACAVVEVDLPQVGDVFLTATFIFNDGDHTEFRPVVIVRAPLRREDLLTTIQRSSTATWQKGIGQPVDASLGLSLDGRWVLDYQRGARCDQFLAAAEPLGRLDDEWLVPLIAAWEGL